MKFPTTEYDVLIKYTDPEGGQVEVKGKASSMTLDSDETEAFFDSGCEYKVPRSAVYHLELKPKDDKVFTVTAKAPVPEFYDLREIITKTASVMVGNTLMNSINDARIAVGAPEDAMLSLDGGRVTFTWEVEE